MFGRIRYDIRTNCELILYTHLSYPCLSYLEQAHFESLFLSFTILRLKTNQSTLGKVISFIIIASFVNILGFLLVAGASHWLGWGGLARLDICRVGWVGAGFRE